jgi:hypothetical protein
MEEEENHWLLAYEDFLASPANGIQGRGAKRKAEYVEQDNNLREIFRTRGEREPLEYLQVISYRLPNPT